MAKPKLQGSFVALITPFQEDGTPDIEGFGRLIEFQAAHGTSALLIMGSTGEVSLLSQEERHQIITETVKFRKHGLPLFYGCTGNNTRETIRMVQYAGRAGADGAVVTVPSYLHAPVDDAVQYFLDMKAPATITPALAGSIPGSFALSASGRAASRGARISRRSRLSR